MGTKDLNISITIDTNGGYMVNDIVLDKLGTKFGLGSKQLSILKSLRRKELNADEVSKATSIPLGRIYGYLNELEREGLISRTNKKPYKYSTKAPKNNVIGFMKRKIDDLINSELEIIDLMQAGHEESISMVDNREDYTRSHIRFLQECKTFHTISVNGSFPFLIYPRRLDSFVKIRQAITASRPTMCETDYETCMLIFKTYMDALEKGVKFKLIFARETFFKHLQIIEEHLGGKFLKNIIRDLIDKIQQYGLKIYITEEYLPTQIDITDKKVSITLRHLETFTGMIIKSPRVRDMYKTLFDQKVSRAKLLLPYLEKLVGDEKENKN